MRRHVFILAIVAILLPTGFAGYGCDSSDDPHQDGISTFTRLVPNPGAWKALPGVVKVRSGSLKREFFVVVFARRDRRNLCAYVNDEHKEGNFVSICPRVGNPFAR